MCLKRGWVEGPWKMHSVGGARAMWKCKMSRKPTSAHTWSARAGAHSRFDITHVESGSIKQYLLKLLSGEPLDGYHWTSAMRTPPCWLA